MGGICYLSMGKIIISNPVGSQKSPAFRFPLKETTTSVFIINLIFATNSILIGDLNADIILTEENIFLNINLLTYRQITSFNNKKETITR